MKTRIFFLLFFAVPAQALELYDGNKIRELNSDRFRVTLSSKFTSARASTSSKVELTGNPNFSSGSGTDLTPVKGFFTTFSQAYPELVSADVDTLRQTFAGIREIVLEDGCKLGFMGVSASTVYGIATWGQGRGVTIVMPFNDEMESAVRDTLEAVTLEADACAWE